jgi:hypothetical protein
MPTEISDYLDRNAKLNAEKTYWNPQWQLVSEFVAQRKADFTSFQQPGAFLNSEIWSDTAPISAETAASAIVGLVWPDNHSFKLEPFGDLKDDEECKKFFEDATEEMQAAMDDPEAGFALSLGEAMNDFVTFGTPAIHCEEGDRTDLAFDAWNVSQFALDEGPDGYVDSFYRGWEFSVRQAVKKFKLENLSKKTQELWNKKKYQDKIKILHIIEPREVNPKGGNGPANMAYASVYIEVDQKHKIRESGFNELPTFAFRFSKKIGEKYGRSPAMRGLPTIMELNALWEMVTIGAEKNYDPPLGVYDDGVFGGGTIDTSAGAINVLNITGKLPQGRSPIEPLFTVGKFDDVATLIERLENTIKDHFLIDRLLDLNNEKEMTAREALIRQAIRQSTLGSIVNRIYGELFDRLLPRIFNMQLRKGRFGYAKGSPEAIAWQAVHPNEDMKEIPEKIVQAQGKNERIYQIRYMTPAAREREAQVAQGIMNTYQFIGEIAAHDQTVWDEPNTPRVLKRIGEIWSFPADLWNTKEEKKALQEMATKQQQAQAGLQQAAQVASIAKDAAAAQAQSRLTPA